MVEKYGLYIHVPFCAQKCYYCDFNSIAIDNELLASYLKALQKEIELVAKKYAPEIRTIYIGGGTPTILSGSQLTTILAKCSNEFNLEEDLEITIEANPGTLNEKKMELIKQAGVNRLSLGVQSFDKQLLQKLGRIHTVKDVINNYFLLRKLGFDNLSFDLMFALPGQSLEDWESTLQQAIALGPEHISAYNLKIEPNTIFGQWLKEDKIEKVDETVDLAMYRRTIELLEQNGYSQYEISNFSQAGYESKHNKIYWNNKEYLALGPGAHFYDGRYRGYNLESIEDYCKQLEAGQLPVAQKNQVSRLEKIEETLILGLRLNNGISLSAFEDRFNESLTEVYGRELKKLMEQNLIKLTTDYLFLTDRGREIANQVLASFILT